VTAWPPWRRDDPTQLLRYVQPGALATVLPPGSRPPGRSGAPPEVRLRQVFAAFAAADVRYADEELGVGGEQDIRPPDQIFTRPGVANCLDLAVAFAGGCLDAGLHPMVVTLTPVSGGVRHAIVVVWLRGDLDAPDYPLAEVVAAREPAWPGMGLRASWEAAGEFVAVDVARVARGWPDPEAQPELGLAVAAAGAMLTDNAWSWEVGVDVGIEHRSVEGYPLPRRPTVVPLEEPYHADARADTGSPLESVRARNRVVPFEPRGELDTIEDWCLAPADEPGRLRLVLVHGVGGAGKTRLAAELAHRLIDRERWYGGFLRRDLTRRRTDPDDPLPDIAWLAEVIGPLLVVVDYVEQADPATLAGHLKVLAGRRWPTVVLLTARFPGDWRRELDNALGSRGVVPESFPDIRLDAHHPRMEVVYRRSYRRFAPASGAPDTPPDLPPAHRRWTTLDVVMLGWLAARFPQSGPPADRATLYERILDREFANWNAFLAEKYHREADVTALRRAAAVVSLLSPATSEATIAALRAGELAELSSLAPGELAGLLRRFLSDPEEGGLALRPDPLADHLITRTFAPNELFDQCTDVAAGTGDSPDLTGIGRLVVNVTRAADSDAGLAGALADRILRRHPQWWPVALGVTWTQGGPFVRPLERLAEREDTPLPLAELAERVPLGHGALPRLALIAADHVARQQTSDVDDHEALDRAARALNNLSNRQAEAGDRASALTSITKAVTAYRRLAEANPDAFLPDLAMSLNNLSNRQAEAGDRASALTSITKAVTAYRRLAEANPDAFLPDLAMSLNNLSGRQAEAGDRAGALTSITEAVTAYRRLAEANPAAFLPDLAGSLNNLSVSQAEVGDRAGALTSITEAVTAYRRLAEANPAAFLPNLAMSLNNLSLRQAEAGDRASALTSITEAVTIRRRLAEANPAAFLPDLATSLNNLSNRQAEAGDRANALTSITEAVTIRRRLAEANPAAFLPDLAMSLNNLSLRQAEAGDRASALTSITEAVTIRRRLAEANPAAFLPDLAMSLNNLSLRQAEAGDRASALTSITEAVTAYRRLAEANPAAFLPNLATSLNNLSNRQAEAGDRANALTSITEAVTAYRRLAEANPDAFLPDLAMSLNNLSNRQAEAGDRANALTSITEAVTAYRRLAEANPDAFLPDLAMSLNNLSNRQAEAGDRANALTSITEAVTIRRRLAEANPAAFLPDLAMSLNNLSNRQAEAGDRANALTSITEAVTIRRRLAEANPAAFLPDLAMSLNNLSNRQAEAGDRANALTSITEAVTIRRRLAEANPAAFLPDLAMSLNTLSNRQAEAGDRANALTSITEAVTAYRRLADTNPAAFLPNLAGSLNNLSNRQAEAGDRANALTSITEAVTIRRRLADTNPAAFLPDLATSLTTRADLMVGEPGGVAAAVTAWDDATDQLPPPVRARLLAYRGRWHHDRGDAAATRDDLLRAARLVDGDTPPGDPTQVSLARQHVRAVLATAHQPGDDFPDWATRPVPDQLIERANAWMTGDWPARRRMLTDQERPVDRDALRVLAALYRDRPALDEWLALLAAIDSAGAEAVLADMDALAAATNLVEEWIATPSWNASQAFLAAHHGLRDPVARAVLERASGDPVARQHLAILRLVDHVSPGAVFDAILDPADARELLFTLARRGASQDLAELLFATARIAADPFAAPLALALYLALDAEPDEGAGTIDDAVAAAVTAASARDRREALELLTALTRIRDDRAAILARIAAAFRNHTAS